jgi:hypothetical protein
VLGHPGAVLCDADKQTVVKVLLRRGSAYESSGQLPLAVADMESVLVVDPSSSKASEVSKRLQRLAAQEGAFKLGDLKSKGNKAFAAKDFGDANLSYTRAIAIFDAMPAAEQSQVHQLF